MDLIGLESRYWQSYILSGGSGEKVSLPLPISGGTCILWLEVSTYIFKASNGQSSLTMQPISLILTLLSLSSPFMGICDYTEPTWIFQTFPISRSLTQSHLQNPFCYEHRFPGSRM